MVGLFLLLIYADIIPLMQPASHVMTFDYPSDREISIDHIFIQVTISSNQTIADRTPVAIHAVGSIGGGFAENVSSVDVYFNDAYYVQNGQVIPFIGPPSAGVSLFVTKTHPPEQLGLEFGGTYLVGSDVVVEWQNPGDYYPTLKINFKNIHYTTRDYPEKRLHLESYATIESEKTNLKLYWTGVAAVMISLVEGALHIASQRERPRRRRRLGDAA